MSWKKFFAFLLAFALILGQFAFAYPSDGMGGGYEGSDFAAQISEIIRENWEDSYFTSIVMRVGSDTMTVDGVERETIRPVIEDGDVQLPLVDIARASGGSAEVSKKTGDIKVEADGRTATVRASASMAASALPAETASAAEVLTSYVTDSGVYVVHYADGTALTREPYVTAEEIESLLGLSVTVDGNTIVITKPYQTKQLIVQMEEGETLHNNYGASRYAADGKGKYLLQYSSIEGARQAHEMLKDEPGVKYAFTNKVLHTTALPSESWGTQRISADMMKESLIESGKTEEELIVAVIDTGAALSHEHLADRLVPGYNAVDPETPPEDDNGHGTHTAGTIVDCTPDNVKIMPVKAFDASGYSTDMSVELAIEYAVENGARLMSMSFSGMDDSDEDNTFEILIRAAAEQGILSVVAAGNDELDIEVNRVTPARMDVTVTVAATDSSDIIAGPGSYQTWGSNFGYAVDVSAPGVNILSSIPGGYTYLSGTSMATPHAAAAAAMLLLEDGELTPEEIKDRLCGMTVDLGEHGKDRLFGYGVIDFRTYFGIDVAAAGIQLSTSSITLYDSVFGGKDILTVSVMPFEATDKGFTIVSSDESVAVYEDGYVWCRGVGTATLTATSTSGGYQAVCEVTVLNSNNWIDYAADSFAGGDGTEEDPYLIATPEELAKLLYEVRVNAELYGDTDDDGNPVDQGYFKLTADIDLAGHEWMPINYQFGPIGGWTFHSSFFGNFDGDGHSVKNMVLTTPNFNGLFGMMAYGYLKNVAVLDASVGSGISGGILLGTAAIGVEVSNCYSTGKSLDAGLIGESRICYIHDCFSTADAARAGFIGRLDATTAIANCYASGFVRTGGGFAEVYNAAFTSWYPKKDTVNCFAVGEVVSGIGFLWGRETGPIEKSYYNNANLRGIGTDLSDDLLDITGKPIEFFKDIEAYTSADNWAESSPWDFENVWAINPEINEGLPYLRTLASPSDKVPEVTDTWIDYAADSYAGGNGTQESPYLIETPEQLARMSRFYRWGGGEDVWFKLTADIDLAGHDWFPLAKGDDLNAIFEGEMSDAYSFSGNILGDGKKITNLTVSSTGDMAGLISNLQYGTVSDLTLENVSISGNNYVGAVAGVSQCGFITNCDVTGSVSGSVYVGGVAGSNKAAAKITGVTADVALTGAVYVGGIAGINDVATIERSGANVSYVSPEALYAGLVYYNNGLITDCYARDTVENGSGLVGNNYYGKVDRSYYVGDETQYLARNVRADNMGDAVTPEQLKYADTFEGWDFDGVWDIDPDVNDGYPYLRLPVALTQAPVGFWGDYAADSYAGGTGTAEDPYLIETPGQLAKIGVDFWTLWNGASEIVHFRLTNDIDLGGHVWESVGQSGFNTYGFIVGLDGGGYEISNMYMKNGLGLFANLLVGSYIKNLGVVGIDGTGSSGLAIFSSATITNCYTTGTIANSPFVYTGGLLGSNNGTVDNCYSTCDVTGYYITGGLIAVNGAGCSVTNSYYTGTLMGLYAGGFIELNSGLVQNCYMAGEILHQQGMFRRQNSQAVNVYFDEELAFGGAYTGFTYAKTTVQMKDIATYEGWDFENVWGIEPDVNGGYPYLLSFAPPTPVAELEVSVTTPTIVATLSAYLNIRVVGEGLENMNLTAYLEVDGNLEFTTPVVNGAGRMYIDKAPEADIYRLVVLGENAEGSCDIDVTPYNTDIWVATPTIGEGGLLNVKFNEAISSKTNFKNSVRIGSDVYSATVINADTLVIPVDYEALDSKAVVVVSGVKYQRLFPSYSFTFTLTVE